MMALQEKLIALMVYLLLPALDAIHRMSSLAHPPAHAAAGASSGTSGSTFAQPKKIVIFMVTRARVQAIATVAALQMATMTP
jgi:hypothetical protein